MMKIILFLLCFKFYDINAACKTTILPDTSKIQTTTPAEMVCAENYYFDGNSCKLFESCEAIYGECDQGYDEFCVCGAESTDPPTTQFDYCSWADPCVNGIVDENCECIPFSTSQQSTIPPTSTFPIIDTCEMIYGPCNNGNYNEACECIPYSTVQPSTISPTSTIG